MYHRCNIKNPVIIKFYQPLIKVVLITLPLPCTSTHVYGPKLILPEYAICRMYLYSCLWPKTYTSWICHLQNRDNFCVHQQKFKKALISQPQVPLYEDFDHDLSWPFHHEMLTIWRHAMTSEVIWWLTYDNKNFRTKLSPSFIEICWVVYMDW